MAFLNRNAPVSCVGDTTARFVRADLDVSCAAPTAGGDGLLFDQSQLCIAHRQPASWLTLEPADAAQQSTMLDDADWRATLR